MKETTVLCVKVSNLIYFKSEFQIGPWHAKWFSGARRYIQFFSWYSPLPRTGYMSSVSRYCEISKPRPLSLWHDRQRVSPFRQSASHSCGRLFHSLSHTVRSPDSHCLPSATCLASLVPTHSLTGRPRHTEPASARAKCFHNIAAYRLPVPLTRTIIDWSLLITSAYILYLWKNC